MGYQSLDKLSEEEDDDVETHAEIARTESLLGKKSDEEQENQHNI